MDYSTAILYIALALYVASMTIHSYRVIAGPTISDRVLAVDCIGYSLLALLVTLALIFEYWFTLHIALVISLFIFTLDIVVSKYLEEV